MTATIESTPDTRATDRARRDKPASRRLTGGWRIVARKEFNDHIHSVRFLILVVLVALAGLASVHSASGPIRDAAGFIRWAAAARSAQA